MGYYQTEQGGKFCKWLDDAFSDFIETNIHQGKHWQIQDFLTAVTSESGVHFRYKWDGETQEGRTYVQHMPEGDRVCIEVDVVRLGLRPEDWHDHILNRDLSQDFEITRRTTRPYYKYWRLAMKTEYSVYGKILELHFSGPTEPHCLNRLVIVFRQGRHSYQIDNEDNIPPLVLTSHKLGDSISNQ